MKWQWVNESEKGNGTVSKTWQALKRICYENWVI